MPKFNIGDRVFVFHSKTIGKQYHLDSYSLVSIAQIPENDFIVVDIEKTIEEYVYARHITYVNISYKLHLTSQHNTDKCIDYSFYEESLRLYRHIDAVDLYNKFVTKRNGI